MKTSFIVILIHILFDISQAIRINSEDFPNIIIFISLLQLNSDIRLDLNYDKKEKIELIVSDFGLSPPIHKNKKHKTKGTFASKATLKKDMK